MKACGCLRCLLFVAMFIGFSPTHGDGSQKSEALRAFYELERQNWLEYVQRMQSIRVRDYFDVTFYHLDVMIGIESPYIEGRVLCRFEPTITGIDSIVLDLHHSLAIDSIVGNSSGFYCLDDSVVVRLDETYLPGSSCEVEVYYHGVPVLAGGYKGLRYETHGNGEPIIASLSTPFLAHYWWPCKDGPGDKPDSVYIDITIPDTLVAGSQLIAVSNGVLEGTITQAGHTTFQWRERYPIVPYYVMVAISNYEHFCYDYMGENQLSFPLDYYVFAEHLAEAQSGVAQLPEVMTLFAGYFGDYPFDTEKYAMSQLGFYGGIENQTNTIINRMSLYWFEVSVHELAHMWFGDMITCESWHHGWLNEGFAVYCEALWAEHEGGFEAYKENMKHNEWLQVGTLYLHDISDLSGIFVPIIYEKGAYVVHMLRGVLGDSLFFECMSAYTADPDLRYDHATTEDLQSICENVSGVDLDFFFTQWVYEEFFPIYQYGFSQDDSSYMTHVEIKQAQNIGPTVFEMPIPLRFDYADGTSGTVVVWNDQREQTFDLPLGKEITQMLLDPDKWILRVSSPLGVESQDTRSVAQTVRLLPNLPNPFSRSTVIRFVLPQSGAITMHIADMDGRLVRTLQQRLAAAGLNTLPWDGRNTTGRSVASGTYVYTIRTAVGSASGRLQLIR